MGIKKPDYFLEAVGESTAETIGNIIAKSDQVMETENCCSFFIFKSTLAD